MAISYDITLTLSPIELRLLQDLIAREIGTTKTDIDLLAKCSAQYASGREDACRYFAQLQLLANQLLRCEAGLAQVRQEEQQRDATIARELTTQE